MSSLRKAANYLQSLQEALKNERYNEVPELSRKVRKHDPARTCFARSAEVQALLEKRLRSSQTAIDDANFNDLSGTFHWLRVDVQELSKERDLLQEAYAAHDSASAEDIAYYDLTNFFYGLVSRQLEATSNLETQLSIHPHNPFLSQTLALRGILEELRGRTREAVREYESFPYPNIASSSFEGSMWFEHIKYRLAILSPSLHNQQTYTTWHAQNKKQASGKLLHVLSTQSDSDLYTQELLRSTRFPSADATNTRLLILVADTLDSWIANGSSPLEAEKHLELLYEAGSKTFHSPRILRYMIRALAALERFEEVFLALDAYLQISLHAQKTQPGTDIDSTEQIVSTVHFVVTRLLKRVSIDHEPAVRAKDLHERTVKIVKSLNAEDQSCSTMLQEIHGMSSLLHYHEYCDEASLAEALECLTNASMTSKSVDCHVALAIVHAQKEDVKAAMASIRAALELDEQSIVALLIFANLLCCEELYDRALAAVERVFSIPNSSTDTFQFGIFYLRAKFMQLKIIEHRDSASKALEKSSELLAAYRQNLARPSGVSNGTSNDAFHEHRTNLPHSQNGIMPSQESSQAPSIRIDPPSTPHPPEFLAPALPSHENPPQETINGSSQLQTRINPFNASTDRLRAVSGPARSSSLKSAQRGRQFRTHLHLRKSASVRSMRGAADSIENSSRSSSPMNHPAPSIHSILPDTSTSSQDIGPDRQPTALEIQDRTRRAILAEIWLYIAHLCRASNAAHAEVAQAIEEARALVGPTPAILSAQLSVRASMALDRGPMTRADVDEIEEGYEYALTLDDTDEKTILSLSQFLLDVVQVPDPECDEQQERVERRARVYEMLESLKHSRSAGNPALWHLSARVAEEMGESERAEQESWRAVETSDVAGVMNWFELWVN